MADIHHSFLGLLVTVLYLLTGVSGETLSMFSRVGDDVSLPCNNVVYPNCSSTIWIYNSVGSTVTVEEVVLGKIKVEKTERADRLSLGSDCSLHVSDVRAEDAGVYTCQQYLTETGPQHGADAPVHLSVLTRSTASTTRPALSTTSTSSAGTSNSVKLPISHIMLFVTLTIMAAIVTIHTTRRNRP
uniref:Ig-like domain-containing protein n=1 Tax=Salmo trutta TaxID=8032 RepID=A0A673W5T4_SALTR